MARRFEPCSFVQSERIPFRGSLNLRSGFRRSLDQHVPLHFFDTLSQWAVECGEANPAAPESIPAQFPHIGRKDIPNIKIR